MKMKKETSRRKICPNGIFSVREKQVVNGWREKWNKRNCRTDRTAHESGEQFNMSRRWTPNHLFPFEIHVKCERIGQPCVHLVGEISPFHLLMVLWWRRVELIELICVFGLVVPLMTMVRMTYSLIAERRLCISHQFNWSKNCSTLHTDDFSIYYY